MMKKIFLICFLLPLYAYTQNMHLLTNEEKAHLYHVVKKSPVLDRNIGHFFDYTGPLSKGKDSLTNFDFIESEISKEPSSLKVNMEELKEAPPGIISELSVKMALWHLYNELKEVTEKEEQANPLIRSFMQELVNNSPDGAIVEKRKQKMLSSKALECIHPNITLNDRIDLVKKMGLSLDDQKKFLEVITNSIETYTNAKAQEIYKMIGGEYPNYQNMMLAAGDGSGTAGLLGEKEEIETDISKKEKEEQKEKQNKGIGLYTYELTIQTKDNKQEITASKEPFIDFKTIPNQLTNIHLSLWGFNYSTQTTVVITKGEKTYLLYGSKQTGELSPDTSTIGKTYASLISELGGKVDAKQEEVFGAKGLEYKLEDYKLQREEILLKIKKAEYKESSLQVVGNRPEKRKTKYRGEHKESALYEQYDKDQKKIRQKGTELSRLHAQLDWVNAKIIEFEEEFQLQKTNLDQMKSRSDKMKTNLGVNQMTHQAQDHVIYEFEDGATFNLKTQDFKFPKSSEEENFRIQLLAVPLSAMSDYADEVQLNISITEDKKEEVFDQSIVLNMNDVFKPNDFRLKELHIDAESEYLLEKYVRYMIDRKLAVNTNVKASGVGFVSQGQIKAVNDQKAAEMKEYPGETKEQKVIAKNTPEFKKLRTSEATFTLSKKNVDLQINSYTDPVISSISKRYSKLTNLKKRNEKLTENEILSALRSMTVYRMLFDKMEKYAESYLKDDPKQFKKFKKQLDDRYDQTYIDMNGMNVSIKELSGYVK